MARRRGSEARLPPAVQPVLLFGAYLLLATLGYLLALQPEGVAVWWVPQGLTLFALLSTPRRRWPALLAAIFLGESVSVLLHGRPVPVAIAWSLANCATPALGARLLQRKLGTPITLTRVREVLWLALLGGLLAPVPGALIAVAALGLWMGAPASWSVWAGWVLSDALGVLALAPLLLSWSAAHRARRPHRSQLVEGAVLLLLLAGISVWVFGMEVPSAYLISLPYLVFPLTLWAALRFGPIGAASATLLIVALAVAHTIGGTGPFAVPGLSPRQRIWSLQAFLAVVSLSALTLAAALAERRASEQRQVLLVKVGELFAGSLEQEAALGKFSRLLAPGLAEGCAVLLRRGERLVPVAVSHVDAQEEERLWRQLGEATVPVEPQDATRGRPGRALHVPLSVRGQTEGWLLLLRSDTSPPFRPEERLLAEELARRCAQALETMRLFQERGEAIAARDEFLSIAAHELRTPLTSLQLQVQSLARLLRDTPVGTAVVEKLRTVSRQVARLSKLAEALLDVARISTGHLELQQEEVDLAELAREVTARFGEDLQKAGCELQLSVQPVRGRWDRLRLEQVLTNLLANAIKFGPGRPVEVRVGSEDGRARLTVRDQGIGISPEAQARIFERFGRAVSFRSYGGLGLGLYVSGQIARAHGGHIRVSSAPGAGATFVLELPALPPAEQRTPAETAPRV